MWGLWLLIAGGWCGAKAERCMRDQELAIALFLWAMILLAAIAVALMVRDGLVALFG